MRYSRQRETVYDVVASTKSHPDADWIYGKVKEVIPAISLGTVYRNLKTLTDSGQLITLETSLGSIHYDADLSPHEHFVCTKCGRISDLFIPSEDVKALEDSGYTVTAEKRIFYGICKECNQKIIKK